VWLIDSLTQVMLGRIVTSPEVRGKGFGRLMMQRILLQLEERFGKIEMRMEAQCYATGFYHKFGFKEQGEEFLEDDIPHILMVRKA